MEPDISPLAKRLAEENNVNWRGLGGSGANGRIVERDVLEYLAKVMAGEEDVNPTAEPVPEGMEAWPEEDTAGYFNESPSIKATDTLTEVVTDMPSVSVEEVSDPFALDEDSATILEPELITPEPVTMDSSEDVFADMDSSSEPAIDDVASTFNHEEVSDVHISEDIFLFDDTAADEASVVATDHDDEGNIQDTDVFMDIETEDHSEAASTLEGDTSDFGFDASEDFTDVPMQASETDAIESETLESTEPPLDANLNEVSDDLFATPSEEGSSDDTALFSDDIGHEEPSQDDSLLEPIAASIEPTTNDGVDHADDNLNGIESETLVPAAPLSTTDLPLSTFGVLLRRHADLGPAMAAQLSISHELGHEEEPIGLSNLLVRAAAKALQTVDIANGQGVGLALFENDGIRVAPVADAHNAPFRDLLEQLGTLDSDDNSVGLVVADMSDLGVDEAVLNLDTPVLALGRILQDSEQGSQHSTLTLSGDVPVESGTQFLSAVAELLASPIRIVL